MIQHRLIITLIFFFVIPSSLFFQSNERFIDELLIARRTFHRTYFEEADRLFKTLGNKNPNDPLILAYQSMIDYMLFRDPDSNSVLSKSNLRLENPDINFIKALIHFVNGEFGKSVILLKKHLEKFPEDSFARHTLGFSQIDNENPTEGLSTLLSLIKSNPDYFPAYNHIGYAYLRLKKHSDAIKYFKLFIESDNSNPSVYDSYADGLSALGKNDLAFAQLSKAVLLDPNFAYGWKHMGDILRIEGESHLAVKAYQNAKKTGIIYGNDFHLLIDQLINEIGKTQQ